MANNVRQYVGARYVPKFADPVTWQSNTAYEAMTIVTYNNSSYTSKIPVPATVGNPADNDSYWVLTGNYNAQVEAYRKEITDYQTEVSQSILSLQNLLDAGYKSAKQYGAVGDGVTDDTEVLQKILDSGEPLLLTAGYYKTTKALTMSNSSIIIGDSQGPTWIICHNSDQTTDNYILGVSSRDSIINLSLAYDSSVALTDVYNAQVGIKGLNTPYGLQRTSFYNVTVSHTNSGLLFDNSTTKSSDSEGAFSVGFFGLTIEDFSVNGMLLYGETGCTLQNVYINNGVTDSGTASASLKSCHYGLQIVDSDCMNIGGLNIEWMSCWNALSIENSTAFISTIHLEEIKMLNEYAGLISIIHSRVSFGMVSVFYSWLASTVGSKVVYVGQFNQYPIFGEDNDQSYGATYLSIDDLFLVGPGTPDSTSFPSSGITRGIQNATNFNVLYCNDSNLSHKCYIKVNNYTFASANENEANYLKNKTNIFYTQYDNAYLIKCGYHKLTGVAADRPDASDLTVLAGDTYYSTDTNVLSVFTGTEWKEITAN